MQTANITISHNAADGSTTIAAAGVGTPAVSGGATITIGDTQAQVGDVVAIPVTVTDVSDLDVTGVRVSIAYDPALLTPKNDGAGTPTTAATAGEVVPPEWAVEQNVPAPGTLSVSLAGALDKPAAGAGTLLTLRFDVSPTAALGAPSPVTFAELEMDEGDVAVTGVDGAFHVFAPMYGDVTGNGDVTPYDASWVLGHVVDSLQDPPVELAFPIEETAPVWAHYPLTQENAHEVANADGDVILDGQPNAGGPDIPALDASLILQRDVEIIPVFPVETPPAAPVSAPVASGYGLRGVSASARPGGGVVVLLDMSGMASLRAGELALDYDPALLRPTAASLRHDADAGRPLLAQREGDGRLVVAFAAARPIGASEALLEVTFEVTPRVSRPTASTIRASHLRLNRSRIETDFAFPFRVEPFANRLMANYPNPFNPETWIPFELAADADVTVRVYGLAGDLVRTLELGRHATGEYRGRHQAAHWDGKNERGEQVASGVYLYELSAGSYRALRRMVVLK